MWLIASIVAVAVVGGLGAAKNAGLNPGRLSLQNGLANTEYGLPACLPVWLSERDQWKSQVWLKACNRRDEAGHMVRRSALRPAGHGAAVCVHGSSSLSTVGDCESGDRLCEVVQS